MKKFATRTGGLVLSVATLFAALLFSCANPLGTPLSSDAAAAKTLSNGVETYTLWAGQTIDAGTVSIWRDASKLYVKYQTNSSFTISQTHVWAGTSLSALPVNNSGVPAPGQFPSVIDSYAAGTTTATVTFDFQPAWEGQQLYIFAHAALLYTAQSGGETGWAGDKSLDINRWNFYMHVLPPTYVPPTTTTTVPAQPNTYAISGTVFHDLDADGVKDSGEEGLAGVSLKLSNGATAVSGADGTYSFVNLPAGSYTVSSGGLTGYFTTPYDSPAASQTRTVPASATGVDFGLSYEKISGSVFRDLDADGVKDSGEQGLAGVSLTLSGAAAASAVSGSDGSYLFDHLKGGSASYTVVAGDLTGEYHTPYLAPVTSWSGAASAANLNFGLSHETIVGVVFYDANRNDVFDLGEPTLSGFTVRLGAKSAVSGDDGSYVFDNLKGATTYTVGADDRAGFVHSVAASRTLAPANSVPAQANFGFAVDYSWLNGKPANGFTIGYWKTNLDKAIAGKTNGIQVSAAALSGYISTLSNFALYPLNVTTMKAASDILSATGSAPALLLSKQLMGSEFNYASGAYIGGNALATYFFLFDGEYMLANPSLFGSAQILAQQARYDAYNNSHGGAVLF